MQLDAMLGKTTVGWEKKIPEITLEEARGNLKLKILFDIT